MWRAVIPGQKEKQKINYQSIYFLDILFGIRDTASCSSFSSQLSFLGMGRLRGGNLCYCYYCLRLKKWKTQHPQDVSNQIFRSRLSEIILLFSPKFKIIYTFLHSLFSISLRRTFSRSTSCRTEACILTGRGLKGSASLSGQCVQSRQ